MGEELQRAERTLAATRGFSVDADASLLGSGSSESNFLVAQALIDPGDVVLAEEFTYAGTLGFLRRFGADGRGVECDRNGILPDSLECQIQTAIDEGRRPKAVYTIPTFQNPLGFVESYQRRTAVTEITARYGVPVWEDDCYVDLNFEHPVLPPPSARSDDRAANCINRSRVGAEYRTLASSSAVNPVTGVRSPSPAPVLRASVGRERPRGPGRSQPCMP